jgi:parallel beta-helix repeat protein
MKVKKVFILILILTSLASARKVSTVLGTSGGTFDPWNQTRWAAWYTNGVLTDYFEIDCNITFAEGTSSTSPWKPSISSSLKTTGYIFLLGSTGTGVTVNGNDAFIDLRPNTYSLSTLYTWASIYGDDSLYGISKCFNVSQALVTTKPATVIKNLWMKGFIQAIRTSSSQRHPLTIQSCEFRFNQWGVYLSGENTTATGCGIKQGIKGGIYLGSGSGRNYVTGNEFQDNDIEQSKLYGDMAMDTAHHCLIANNNHLAPEGGSYHVAIKMYRNTGESSNLRENAPNQNIIRGNSIDGYSAGYEIGSRMGKSDASDYDISKEARDYAAYNLFENNTFNNTIIGIKLNTSGNTIRGNTFTTVTKPIVLHCVFYTLTETTINDQAGTDVYYWFKSSDYSSYSSWFPYQAERSSGVAESAKLIQMHNDYGAPNYQNYTGQATILKTPSLIVDSNDRVPDLSGDQYMNFQDMAIFGNFWERSDSNVNNNFCNGSDMNFNGGVDNADLSRVSNNWLIYNNMADVYAAGGKPIDIAVGDFWVANGGDEVAVIWDTPVSNIDGTDYYSIIIYDSNGIEINRCGRSTVRWGAIAAGNFVNIGSSETGQEIAAVHSTAVSGYYPVYIFGRGRADPNKTMLSTNTTPIIDLAGGNFNTGTDSYDEIAVLYNGETNIGYVKPTLSSWSSTTANTSNLVKFAAGNFDGTSSNGDEMAGINNQNGQIYLYHPGGTTYYATAGSFDLPVWSAIGAGDFYYGSSRQEIAVASSVPDNGIYKISYFISGAVTAFKYNDQDVLGVPVLALDGGKLYVPAKLGLYERADGFYSSNYSSTTGSWGEHALVLPSAAQSAKIPLFWVNANPLISTQQYLKVMPIVK